MKVVIQGNPKEIAVLVAKIQERQLDRKVCRLSFSNASTNNLVEEHSHDRKSCVYA